MRILIAIFVAPGLLLGAAALAGSGASFVISETALGAAPTIIVFGDSRFTEPTNVTSSNPLVRQALVARLAEERPDAVIVTGDLVWHGNPDDYREYLRETEAWRTKRLRIFPALGNHEFQRCGAAEECLGNWWGTFPELNGHRWYSAQFGSAIYAILLDSDDSFLPDSAQRKWLEAEVAALPAGVRFLLVALHHPPVTGIEPPGGDSPRPNEIELATYLKAAARGSPHVRFVVVAGHIHNYARFLRDDVTYLISGGGAGIPTELDRGPSDLYQDPSFPNYHYVKLVLNRDRLTGTMWRLVDPGAEMPVWEIKDRFEVAAKGVHRDVK
jgi:acid phosphatase type 7